MVQAPDGTPGGTRPALVRVVTYALTCAALLRYSFDQTRILLSLLAGGALLWLAGRIDFGRRGRKMAGR